MFSDVDSAFATLNSNLVLLRSYKARTWIWRAKCATRFRSRTNAAPLRCWIS